MTSLQLHCAILTDKTAMVGLHIDLQLYSMVDLVYGSSHKTIERRTDEHGMKKLNYNTSSTCIVTRTNCKYQFYTSRLVCSRTP